MTKKERKHFRDCWLEAENIISLIEPEFIPEKQFRRPEQSGPAEIKLLLGFLRLLVRALLHDRESSKRETQSLAKIVDQHIHSNS